MTCTESCPPRPCLMRCQLRTEEWAKSPAGRKDLETKRARERGSSRAPRHVAHCTYCTIAEPSSAHLCSYPPRRLRARLMLLLTGHAIPMPCDGWFGLSSLFPLILLLLYRHLLPPSSPPSCHKRPAVGVGDSSGLEYFCASLRPPRYEEELLLHSCLQLFATLRDRRGVILDTAYPLC